MVPVQVTLSLVVNFRFYLSDAFFRPIFHTKLINHMEKKKVIKQEEKCGLVLFGISALLSSLPQKNSDK